MIILCGGSGIRLRPVVADRPKVLAKIKGKPFLDILIENLLAQGFSDLILSTGYLGEQIKYHFKDRNFKPIFSEEKEPLGTGGALRKAKPFIGSNPFLVMNGDSMVEVNFKKLINFHAENNSLMTMVLAESDDFRDYGNIELAANFKIKSFQEKRSNGPGGLINAGIYAMSKEIFSFFPNRRLFSLEYDIFPNLISKQCFGFLSGGKLIDIGTPERYWQANNH